jgi:hypothetical protein
VPPTTREDDVRFRYFDPMQQSTIEGDLADGAEVADLVGRLTALRADCVPALELSGRDGSSLLLGVSADRAVVLWTSAEGASSHSIGARADGRVAFDYFGALTQLPGHFAVPLATALHAAGGYVEAYARTGAVPALPLAAD